LTFEGHLNAAYNVLEGMGQDMSATLCSTRLRAASVLSNGQHSAGLRLANSGSVLSVPHSYGLNPYSHPDPRHSSTPDFPYGEPKAPGG
jgi:hypothetical protein